MSIQYTRQTITEKAYQIMGSNAPYSQEEIRAMQEVLLSFSMNEIDFNLAKALCGKFIQSRNEALKMIAIISVGHMARVYGRQVNFVISA